MTWVSDEAIERLRAVACPPEPRAARAFGEGGLEFGSERYRVTQEIGRGGMGTVYAAIDEELGREVAIKVSNTTASAAFERRLAAEARVLARLEHPGIVPIHDVGRLADGRLFYVMKRVQGMTLREHRGQVTDLGERLRIFERICEAVAFAHARRILHRDLKPDNVMIGAFGEVMVMDWGVAKSMAPDDTASRAAVIAETALDRVAAETEAGAIIGTRGFMAPEQARGDTRDLDERTDVYALGAILLALLTGRDTGSASLPQPEALERAPSIPRPLWSVCTRALAARPDDRYVSASALREDVARFRAGQAVHAHRETAFERTARLAKVYRTPILLVVAYMIMRALFALAVGRG